MNENEIDPYANEPPPRGEARFVASDDSEFANLRMLLQTFRETFGQGGVVAVTWQGDMMQVMLSRPETGKVPFVMDLDDEQDYAADKFSEILSNFANASRKWFNDETQGFFEDAADKLPFPKGLE